MQPGSQGEWTRMSMHDNDDFTILIIGGGRHLWVSTCAVWPSFPKWLSRTNLQQILQSVLMKHQTTEVTQPQYSPDLLPWDFWLFQKLKSPLKGKRFQTLDEIQENMTGQLMVIDRTVWGPKGPTLKGLRCHCPVYNVSCIFNKCLFFMWCGWILSGQTSYIEILD